MPQTFTATATVEDGRLVVPPHLIAALPDGQAVRVTVEPAAAEVPPAPAGRPTPRRTIYVESIPAGEVVHLRTPLPARAGDSS